MREMDVRPRRSLQDLGETAWRLRLRRVELLRENDAAIVEAEGQCYIAAPYPLRAEFVQKIADELRNERAHPCGKLNRRLCCWCLGPFSDYSICVR